MFKNITVTLAAAILTFGLVGVPLDTYTNEAEAKSFGRSSSFSRSSMRSSSSSRSLFSNSSVSKSTKRSTTKYSTTKQNTSAKTDKRSSSITGKSSTRTSGVLKEKRQRQQFKKKPVITTKSGTAPKTRIERNAHYNKQYRDNPVYSRGRSYDRSTYGERRDRYYRDYNPPVYVYNSSPSFGMWDTIFLYSMLNNMNHASSFAYHQQNNPDYIAWRREADSLARDNAELRAQLRQMDSGKAGMSGAVNPGYLPEGVDADIALAQEARTALLPSFKICVGGLSGAYARVGGGVFAPHLDMVNATITPTQGTGQALEYIRDGKCDAAFVQGDGYWNYVERNETDVLPFERASSLYKEYVHLVCHEDGPSSVKDLDEDNAVWFPAGSGAAETWQNFIAEDDDYAEVKTVLNTPSMNVDSNAEALLKVSKNDCMMYVAAPGATKFMRDVEKSAKRQKLVLIDVNDGDMDDTTDPSGADVYEFSEIDSSVYPNLTRQAGALWGSGDIHTPKLNADFIISTAWKTKNAKAYPEVVLGIRGLQDRVDAAVRQ